MNTTRTLPPEMTIYTVAELYRQCLAWLSEVNEAAAAGAALQDALVVQADAVAEVDASGVQLLLALDRSLRGDHLSLRLSEPSEALAAACQALGVPHLLAAPH